MSLSRINTYKRKKRKQRKTGLAKNVGSKTGIKQFFLVSTIAGTAFFSTSIAYAEFGISDYLKKWYEERVHEAEMFLTTSTENEVNNQKANLLRQVREQTIQSVSELQDYAKSKQEDINNNILEKVNETVNIIESQNQEDIDAAKKGIDEETNSELPTEKEIVEPGLPGETENKEDSGSSDGTEKDGEPKSPEETEKNEGPKSPEESKNNIELPDNKEGNPLTDPKATPVEPK